MASEAHLILSDFIKSVHQTLREASQNVGAQKAWQVHCANEEKLKKYANAMKDLATNYWEQNNQKQPDIISRISWTYNMCLNYFSSEIIKYREKEEAIAIKLNINITFADSYDLNNVNNINRLKLLDVGSCYNPFSKYNCFNVTAIDIAPAVESVFMCDFLNVKIEKSDSFTLKNNAIYKLPTSYFDIIVFCLLLEYLPCPRQRHICCEKAYSLLKTEGLLIVITPDSNHVGSNAKYIKSWRFILAEIGFSRIKYEKLAHIHCMAFRKAASKKITKRWAEIHKNEQMYTEIFIPQDFKIQQRIRVVDNKNKDIHTQENDLKLLSELPGCDVLQ